MNGFVRRMPPPPPGLRFPSARLRFGANVSNRERSRSTMEPEPLTAARSAGWGSDVEAAGDPARARTPRAATAPEGYPAVSGRVAYLDLPDGAVGVAALVKVRDGDGARWELQATAVEDHELLGALRVQAAILEDRLRRDG